MKKNDGNEERKRLRVCLLNECAELFVHCVSLSLVTRFGEGWLI